MYEQLIHADLRETVEKGCFHGINFFEKGELNGTYFVQVYSIVKVKKNAITVFLLFLQINSMIDVGCSAHNKLKDQIADKSFHVSGKRLLLLDITDGVTELKAMEYEHIFLLDSKIKPGAKVM